MKNRLLRTSLVSLIVLVLLYLVLMVVFGSPSPLDIFHYAANDSWCLDSASVVRRVHHFKGTPDQERYQTTADSAWDFSISVYGRNLVQRSLRIDSIEVLDLDNRVAYPVHFFEHFDPRSRKTVNRTIVVGKQVFEYADYVDAWSWRARDQGAEFQAQFDGAFQKRSLVVRVRSSRGVRSILPSHYITTGHFLEWTEDVRVLNY